MKLTLFPSVVLAVKFIRICPAGKEVLNLVMFTVTGFEVGVAEKFSSKVKFP